MDSHVLSALRCPVCQRALCQDSAGLLCDLGHRFDRARQGHIDLTGGRITHPGDTSEMVASRSALLSSGRLSPVTQAVVDALAEELGQAEDDELVVDIGAGTAHHLAHVLRARPGACGLAVDVSKAALRRAARAHPRIAAIRADIWRGLPILDHSARAVLDIFAPRSAAEFHRVLRPDGVLIVVTPARDHLAQLTELLGLISIDQNKERRLVESLSPRFRPVFTWRRSSQATLTSDEAKALVLMGPNAWHLDPDDLTARLGVDDGPIVATISLCLHAWRPVP